MDFNQWLLIALAVRLLMVGYAIWHDEAMPVKYTDIDYEVFTDAAKLVVAGESPYGRQTYRYPPVLAWMLTGNVLWVKVFGKVVFGVVDVLVGWCLVKAGSAQAAVKYLWLFNPVVVNVSTRGNADSLVLLPLTAALSALLSHSFALSGALLALAVHLRLFPVIYLPSIGLYLLYSVQYNFLRVIKPAFTFGMAFAFVLALTTWVSYCFYGSEYLENAYFYHYGRVDHRHNLSMYFLPAYHERSVYGGFFPQLLSILVVSFKFHRNPGYAMLLATMLFVTLNKVVTVQYFTWYFSLLPPALPSFTIAPRAASAIAAIWIGSLLLWLSVAYRLEFLAEQVYIPLWACSGLFLAANTLAIVSIINGYTGGGKETAHKAKEQ
eukprot:TRINITY_DN15500_c0_g1_i1.p1 TRINITY_DN15500_c0_g1~~TRINITY_DN15500_c0_g1_i1.p1  ORF type:complete len:392 (+),score=55.63 TRINITY_DN15500_c0_g1_i1:40-1176(+)